jgi:Na+-transporting NADH:ubiquinone oxidoreductase subunit NqrB
MMKRPFGVTVVAVLMCIGAALLAIGSVGFFVLGGAAVTTRAGGPTSQLFSEMGSVGAGLFTILAVVYATLAIYMFRLVSWARLASISFISMGLFFAAVGIVGSFPHPDFMVLAWQLFVIAVDAWILWYLATPHVKRVFAGQGNHSRAHVEAHT